MYVSILWKGSSSHFYITLIGNVLINEVKSELLWVNVSFLLSLSLLLLFCSNSLIATAERTECESVGGYCTDPANECFSSDGYEPGLGCTIGCCYPTQ